MKKVIIVAPHFPPSNLAAVHRSRLFAMHLPSFGWEPIVVTVDHRYYEELQDWNLAKLVPASLRIESVRAWSVKPFRLVGDIGVRGFIPMLRRILKIIRQERIDFLYIPIPSNYAALLGRIVYERTKIPYGIDYIDPWVHTWPGTEHKGSKAWWSMKLSEWLEPFAVKRAALITGVAKGYYEDVFQRNPQLQLTCLTAAMPYGAEHTDHEAVSRLEARPYLFEKVGKLDLVYAGAMLPKAFEPLRQMMRAIQQAPLLYQNVRFHFIGTGKSPNDTQGYNVKSLAEEFNLWQRVIFEYPRRIPYLEVLIHLAAADGVFILGSTEPHYTPSKVYQAVLSEKPILAVLHEKSTACQVITQSKSGVLLTFPGEQGISSIHQRFNEVFTDYHAFVRTFNPAEVDKSSFEAYSAYEVTRILANSFDKLVRSK